MLRIARILFPIDFPDRCAVIGGRVKALVEHFQAEVVLLYAWSLCRRTSPHST